MSGWLGRIKRAVRASIAANGGISGAQITVEKGSVVGDWHNLNHKALPLLADVQALDEVALASSGAAPILRALAAELGHVAIRLPEASGNHENLAVQMARATGEFGDIASALTAAIADGVIDPSESDAIIRQIDEAQEALTTLRMLALKSSDGAA